MRTRPAGRRRWRCRGARATARVDWHALPVPVPEKLGVQRVRRLDARGAGADTSTGCRSSMPGSSRQVPAILTDPVVGEAASGLWPTREACSSIAGRALADREGGDRPVPGQRRRAMTTSRSTPTSQPDQRWRCCTSCASSAPSRMASRSSRWRTSSRREESGAATTWAPSPSPHWPRRRASRSPPTSAPRRLQRDHAQGLRRPLRRSFCRMPAPARAQAAVGLCAATRRWTARS
jgi:hypothetical protein